MTKRARIWATLVIAGVVFVICCILFLRIGNEGSTVASDLPLMERRGTEISNNFHGAADRSELKQIKENLYALSRLSASDQEKSRIELLLTRIRVLESRQGRIVVPANDPGEDANNAEGQATGENALHPVPLTDFMAKYYASADLSQLGLSPTLRGLYVYTRGSDDKKATHWLTSEQANPPGNVPGVFGFCFPKRLSDEYTFRPLSQSRMTAMTDELLPLRAAAPGLTQVRFDTLPGVIGCDQFINQLSAMLQAAGFQVTIRPLGTISLIDSKDRNSFCGVVYPRPVRAHGERIERFFRYAIDVPPWSMGHVAPPPYDTIVVRSAGYPKFSSEGVASFK
jgi:hypothetical protein